MNPFRPGKRILRIKLGVYTIYMHISKCIFLVFIFLNSSLLELPSRKIKRSKESKYTPTYVWTKLEHEEDNEFTT